MNEPVTTEEIEALRISGEKLTAIAAKAAEADELRRQLEAIRGDLIRVRAQRDELSAVFAAGTLPLRESAVKLKGQIADLQAEVQRVKLIAAEQQGFAARHQHDALRAQQETQTWRDEFMKAESRANELFGQLQTIRDHHATEVAGSANLLARIDDLHDLLRSAHAIAGRQGEDTNWEAFIGQLRQRGIGSITAKTFRRPKDYVVQPADMIRYSLNEVARWLNEGATLTASPEGVTIDEEGIHGVTVTGAQAGHVVTSAEVEKAIKDGDLFESGGEWTESKGREWCKVTSERFDPRALCIYQAHHGYFTLCDAELRTRDGVSRMVYTPVLAENLPKVSA